MFSALAPKGGHGMSLSSMSWLRSWQRLFTTHVEKEVKDNLPNANFDWRLPAYARQRVTQISVSPGESKNTYSSHHRKKKDTTSQMINIPIIH